MMKYYVIILTLLSILSIYDATLLWRINVNPPAYLLGTAHLPFPYLWPFLSDTAKSAFYNSTHFLPEFDMTNFFAFSRLQMCLNSQKSSTANDPIRLGFLRGLEAKIPILDIHLILEARRLKKTVESLESIDIYCEFAKFQMASHKQNLTSYVDKSFLPEVNEYEQVKHLYNCDLNYNEELFPSQSTNHIEDSALISSQQSIDEIVERRDKHTSQKINDLLKGASPNDRFFFAVGFIHLMSPKGIVAKLRNDYKYSVTRLCTDPLNFRATLNCQGPSWCDSRSH